jgi:hypothetical protein
MPHLTRKVLESLSIAAVLAAPVWGVGSPSRETASPGTLNYVEGQASIGAQTLTSKSVGSVDLATGQSLVTRNGRVEVLLTPGVFLRAGDSSSVTMLSPNLIDTKLSVDKGDATVEVDEIHSQNDLRIVEDGSTTRLLHTGFYDFNADQGEIRVLQGQAVVRDGDRRVKVKGGHEVDLRATSGSLSEHKFNKNAYKSDDPLYRWSSLRSAYLAEANVNAAPAYYVGGWYGPGWWGAGWYWDPWFDCYTFIPGDGIFYSPFGWGFYSPWYVGYAPYYSFGYRRGFGYYQHYYAGRALAAPAPRVNMGRALAASPQARGSFGVMGPAFHGGGGFHGGGFGGGGFHGGGGPR